MEAFEGLLFPIILQVTRRPFDPLLHKSLFDLDAVAAASNNIGLVLGSHDLANVGGLPAWRELRSVLPEIEHPTARIAIAPSSNVGDLANDLLPVHVLKVHDVLPDHFRIERMKDRDAFKRI